MLESKSNIITKFLVFIFPLLLLSISLLTTCINMSAIKPFWYDELLTYHLVTDKSLFHMLDALADGVDGGFPLYYIIVWLWEKALSA